MLFYTEVLLVLLTRYNKKLTVKVIIINEKKLDDVTKKLGVDYDSVNKFKKIRNMSSPRLFALIQFFTQIFFVFTNFITYLIFGEAVCIYHIPKFLTHGSFAYDWGHPTYPYSFAKDMVFVLANPINYLIQFVPSTVLLSSRRSEFKRKHYLIYSLISIFSLIFSALLFALLHKLTGGTSIYEELMELGQTIEYGVYAKE